ncbi:ABC transporter substrate-binding protein [Actinopolymorpha alba]|uniref:ABC transporter substrate-binding protein n=1 Tax=Actinopolymorpha alba TaxID=533267 RepID=UPI00037A43F8|nr:ABC transporter substrate-binding protein [Actinopolymorpha alba]
MHIRSFRPRWRVLIVPAAVLSLAAASCGTGSQNTSGDARSASATEPVRGGTLKYALASDPECVDPQQKPQISVRMIGRQLTDSLTEQDPETGEILPWLATSWEVSEDARRFTFHLRKDVTFSDGTPFDAEAVKANFERILRLGAGAPQAIGFIAGYKGTTIVDKYTAEVDFEKPNAQFLQASATQSLGILSPKTVTKDPKAVCLGDISGTGPFTLERYTPQQGVVLKRRDDYAWASPLAKNKGAAYLDRVDLRIIPENGVRTGSLSSGQVDAIETVPTADVATLEKNPGFSLLSAPLPAISIPYIPHVYSPRLRDARVRRALSLGLNRQEIVNAIYAGVYPVATGVLTKANPGYANLGDNLSYDPDQAVRLLEEAGWTKVGKDGIRVNAKGERLSLEIQYVGTGTPAEQMHQLVQQQWKKIGVDFVLKPQKQLPDLTRDKLPYDISTWSQTRGDVDVLRTVYSSFFSNMSMLYGHPDKALDQLLTGLQTTIDTQHRNEIAAKAQARILDQGYAIPVYDLLAIFGISKRVGGFKVDTDGKPIFNDAWKRS